MHTREAEREGAKSTEMASGEERARVAQALYYCASASCALLVYDPTDFKRKTIGPRDAGEELKRERYVC